MFRRISLFLIFLMMTFSGFSLLNHSESLFKTAPSLQEVKKRYKIFILWAGLGEYEWAKRLEKACTELGWESQSSFSMEELYYEKFLPEGIQPMDPLTLQKTIEEFEPDLIISLRDDRIFSSKFPNYLVLSGGGPEYYHWINDKILKFDGILHASKAMGSLKIYMEAAGKKFFGICWYPSCAKTSYQELDPKKIFYCGFQWDTKRNGAEYRKMFSLLDGRGYLEVYGLPTLWEFTPNSRKGLLPFDGESITQAIKKSGIALVLHTTAHIEFGAPTSRIFEAASAGSVIISDKNPFIVENFGDSVLYIDGDKNGEELFQQIDGHYNWIINHPKEAEEKARRAHQIFVEKFSLEDQLLNLAALHEEILKEKENSKTLEK